MDNPRFLASAIIYLSDRNLVSHIRQRYRPSREFEDEFFHCRPCDCPRWCEKNETCWIDRP